MFLDFPSNSLANSHLISSLLSGALPAGGRGCVIHIEQANQSCNDFDQP
jgi:hypothetical protein